VAHKLVIILLNVSSNAPMTLSVPFFQATAAAAMDLEVEIYFAAQSAALLRRGFADTLFPSERREKSIYSFMQDAHQAGVKFYACQATLKELGINEENVIPEFDGSCGGAAVIGSICEDGVVTLTY